MILEVGRIMRSIEVGCTVRTRPVTASRMKTADGGRCSTARPYKRKETRMLATFCWRGWSRNLQGEEREKIREPEQGPSQAYRTASEIACTVKTREREKTGTVGQRAREERERPPGGRNREREKAPGGRKNEEEDRVRERGREARREKNKGEDRKQHETHRERERKQRLG